MKRLPFVSELLTLKFAHEKKICYCLTEYKPYIPLPLFHFFHNFIHYIKQNKMHCRQFLLILLTMVFYECAVRPWTIQPIQPIAITTHAATDQEMLPQNTQKETAAPLKNITPGRGSAKASHHLSTTISLDTLYRGIFLMLASLGLLMVGLEGSLELFFLTGALSLWRICSEKISLPLFSMYILYCFLPILFIHLYKRFKENDSKIPIDFWHGLYGVLLCATVITTLGLGNFLARAWNSQWKMELWLPGTLGCLVGAMFLWCVCLFKKGQNLLSSSASKITTKTTSKETSQSPTSSMLATSHYWWLVALEIGFLASLGEERALFSNLFIQGLFPFLYRGMRRVMTWSLFQPRSAAESTSGFASGSTFVSIFISACKVILGFLTIALVIPLIFVILYELFYPWIKKEKKS